jgi:two-component sensor histidine kinase
MSKNNLQNFTIEAADKIPNTDSASDHYLYSSILIMYKSIYMSAHSRSTAIYSPAPLHSLDIYIIFNPLITLQMSSTKFIFLYLTALTLSFAATAQNTPPDLAVKTESESSAARINKLLQNAKGGTAKVNLMLQATHIYWKNVGPKKLEIDTLQTIANAALALSRSLHYDAGITEATFMLLKTYTRKDEPVKAIQLVSTVSGESRVRMLLSIAEYYTFYFDSGSKEFAEGLKYINKAFSLCKAINSARWLTECQMLLGKYRFSQGNIPAGKQAMMAAITAYEKNKEYNLAAAKWTTLGSHLPDNAQNYLNARHSFEQAVRYYALAGNGEELAYAYRELGSLNVNHNHLDSAEAQLLRVPKILNSINKPVKFNTNIIISQLYSKIGKDNKALGYAFLALKSIDIDEKKRAMAYLCLGMIYRSTGAKETSLKYLNKSYEFFGPRNYGATKIAARHLSELLAETGKPKKALLFLSNYVKNHELTPTWTQIYASSFGIIYTELRDYRKAEQEYKHMLSLNKAVEAEVAKNINGNTGTLTGSAGYFTIGKFYIERKQYLDAKYYLSRSLDNPQYIDAREQSKTRYYLFQADSALQNYLPAIRNYQLFQRANDSINSVARNNQIAELSVRFETEQKENDIKQLRSKEKLQDAAMERANTSRKVILGGAAGFFLLALISTLAYRNKQKSNRELTQQREEINHKNEELQELLTEKDNFLKEKDWLLKEVHHRVKNNLQIVMSLLSTQSVFLENNDALQAIQESQNRVQSIALIHQKLYSSDNLASISMPDYVSDLIFHLAEGLDTVNKGINFAQNIELINVDLSQAVPLGLILNEAITNAIKYAFSSEGGQISVSFKRMESNMVLLAVEDNGGGLPQDFDLRSANSLGMEMMKGLSKQLKGTFEIMNNSGTRIRIIFQLAETLHARPKV